MKSSQWINFFLWKCCKHIPSSLTYPATFPECSVCRNPRPDDYLRPNIDGTQPNPPPRKPTLPPPPKIDTPVVAAPEDPTPEIPIEGSPPPDPDPVPGFVPAQVPYVDELAAAVMAEQDQRVFEAIDDPNPVPTNGKSSLVCPGPKCRRLSRRNSPYCSKVCSDRCYRLRKKANHAPLTDQEVTHLNHILSVLDAWNSR